MITDADRQQMSAGLAEIRTDNETDIVLRRGTTTLAAQKFRVAMIAGFQRFNEASVSRTVAQVTMLGKPGADIQIGDRFTLRREAYTVTAVRSDSTLATQAEAQLQQ
jgi:hypothetical protein